jgi:hypothetical protein
MADMKPEIATITAEQAVFVIRRFLEYCADEEDHYLVDSMDGGANTKGDEDLIAAFLLHVIAPLEEDKGWDGGERRR